MNWTFHVFTHEKDEYTSDILLAISLYFKYISENGCARLYIEIYQNGEDNDLVTEDCILSYGEFPE